MQKTGGGVRVLGEAIASQIDIHRATGGVVPEVAAREHVSVIRPLIERVMHEAGCEPRDLDAMAVTVGPGLMPALSVGVTAARTLAYVWDKPIVPVHHIEGHIASALLSAEESTKTKAQIPNNFKVPNPKQVFPALALIVSGGHTLLIRVSGHVQYKVIGSTRDDAVGEVFDKVGRMLGLPYPGGPHVSQLAQQGDAAAFPFPRPMLASGDLNFSYSGLKTSVYYAIRRRQQALSELPRQVKADIAASFQAAVVDSLLAKLEAASRQDEYATILLAGGVAANRLLRQRLGEFASARSQKLQIAPLPLCGDNAVMIGLAGLFAFAAGRLKVWTSTDARARVSIEDFTEALTQS